MAANSKARTPKAPAAPYKPTEREQVVLDAWRAQRTARPPTADLKVTENAISSDHPDAYTGSVLNMQAVGTVDPAFYEGLLLGIANAVSKGPHPDANAINFALSVVRSVEPRNEIEAMLGAQMAAVHMATMTFARRLNHVETIPQQDAAEKAFNKLARTFALQVEALAKLRRGGEQKVVVEHVHVHAGGQAIVGAVTQAPGGGGSSEKRHQPHAPSLGHAPVTPLHGVLEEDGAPMPLAGGEGL